MYRLFLVVSISLLVVNCTKEIDFLLDSKTEGLAISCKFNSRDFSLFFSSTTGILEGEYPRITKLKVTLFEKDSAIYSSVIDTNHLLIPYFAKTGIPYRLIVEDTIGNVLTGKATMPKKVFLGNCTMKMTEDKEVSDFINMDYTEASVTINDPGDEKNYYELLIYQVYEIDGSERFKYWNSYKSEDPVLQSEGNLDYEPGTVFFSDELFNGQKYTLSIYSSDGNGSCSYGTCMPYEHSVELRSISKEYYEYLKYFTRHYYNQQTVESDPGLDMLFHGEPIDMYTNIENGYGIFTGYSYVTKNFTLISTVQ